MPLLRHKVEPRKALKTLKTEFRDFRVFRG